MRCVSRSMQEARAVWWCLIIDDPPLLRQTRAAIDCRWYSAAHDESVGEWSMGSPQPNSEVTITVQDLVMAVRAYKKLVGLAGSIKASSGVASCSLVKELVSSATSKLHSASRSLISMCISALPKLARLFSVAGSRPRPSFHSCYVILLTSKTSKPVTRQPT